MADIVEERALSQPITVVPGIGPARAAVFAEAGVYSIEDLLLYLPFRYEDRSRVVDVTAVAVGDTCTLKVVVNSCRRVGRGRGGRVEATVSDASGKMRVVWFQQPYVADSVHKDDVVWLFGKVGEHDGKPQLANPVFEVVAEDEGVEGEAGGMHVGRVVPIYRRIGSLTPGVMRRLVTAALEVVGDIGESLPAETRRRLELAKRGRALREVHSPPDDARVADYNAGASDAHRRLVCEEFLGFQTALQMRRRGAEIDNGNRQAVSAEAVERYIAALPFSLTAGQESAIEEVLADMRSARAMHRLLQGDVGCGKTVVAGCAMLAAAEGGKQAALMAPTEILARQHQHWLSGWAECSGFEVVCLTGSTPARQRDAILRSLRAGETRLVVGTHALIESAVEFSDLGLAVIDEQHRFGVHQRAALASKGAGPKETEVDVLVMTATPIPRTLALTLYGDLDVCTIPDMPPGRQVITSKVVPASAWKHVIEALRSTVAEGGQAYVVAPRIEAGDDELAAAVRLEEDLQRQLPGVDVGLVHGGQRHEEKAAAMGAFVNGDTQVLAATTVIEVGVDVPNAALMVIGHAESFGLAQLHQLRGRVGRGKRASTCLFIAHEPISEMARARLEVIARTSDGFELAERDLLLRGPGEILGTRQAGLSGLRVGDPFRDHGWLERTREEALRLLQAEDPESAAYRERVRSFWSHRLSAGRAG